MGFVGGMFGGGKGTEGLFGSHNAFEGRAAELQNVDFATALQQAMGQTQQAINAPEQQQLITALSNQAQGNGPSVAQNQLNQTTAQNINKAQAMASSQKGVNPALAAKMGVDAANQANMGAQGQAATLRAQEQLGAYGQLGNALSNRAQVANQNMGTLGGLMNTANANTIQNQMGAQGLNAAVAQQNTAGGQAMAGGLLSGIGGLLGGGAMGKAYGGEVGFAMGGPVGPMASDVNYGMDVSDPAFTPEPMSGKSMPATPITQVADSKTDSGKVADTSKSAPSVDSGPGALYQGMADFMSGFNGQAAKNQMDNAQGMMGGAGGMGMMAMLSDENQKTNVKGGDASVKSFLDALKAHQYNYKESAGVDNKKHVSPMAQEMEKSEMGKQLVKETPKGKEIDYSKSGPAIMSALAYLNEKISKMADPLHHHRQALVPGDHPKNDIVPAWLSPGEIVIPRSIAQSDDAAQRSKEFVEAIKRKKK